MTNVAEASTGIPVTEAAPGRQVAEPNIWSRSALGAVLLLSIVMDFFQLGQNGYGNLYYAAGVRSMTDSWHNFFFVSLDPGGFVTVDKPPVGFWLQTLSSKIFGFTPFSIFFPQALCGVLSVLLLYMLVRRHFGVVAGLVASLVLALTPISVVTNRNNTIDSVLALALLLAAWAVIQAAESGKLRWLLLSAGLVGLGFNVKMAEAYLIIPALGLVYLLCAPRKIWTRSWHLLLALLVLLVVSLSWAAIVDLTPVSQRPYVGSTKDNSELSLAFGYNGLNRLHITVGDNNHTSATGKQSTTVRREDVKVTRPAANNSSGSFLLLFHLFTVSLGSQIAWFLPCALLGMLALVWQRRPNFQKDRQQLGLVLWGIWFLTMAVFFSLDNSFHQYYLVVLAPGLSACVGIGLVTMWQDYRRAGWRGWLLPLTLALTAFAQVYIVTSYPLWSQWLIPLVGGVMLLVVILLLILRLLAWGLGRMNSVLVGSGLALVCLALLALLIAPTLWSGYVVMHNTESSFPTAGPNAHEKTAPALPKALVELVNVDHKLVAYLIAHQGNTQFLVATPSSGTADPLILSTNKPVMALGGFGGSDPIVTTADLKELIVQQKVRFFLLSASTRNVHAVVDGLSSAYRASVSAAGSKLGGSGQQEGVPTWVASNCKLVPTSKWRSTKGGGNTSTLHLYDCADMVNRATAK
ncbi:glycosyltransferase family 39 protein [Dictyobacter arantiisoli]|uniref:Dolichyl-phosphate-mannose--protein mannosyltransferase n=1 Tax=Dictyobacter arantiisoli TaxID=2014874 RepID=A0A5A5TC73_9CHLR|nr:glycosyltransferase family 39 protein [Dictyobacter arantiisoli]GCF08927.1 dolichyl-phosphate-mannose--protein mannosyltransferase [Dictyobacter arantiisoli]